MSNNEDRGFNTVNNSSLSRRDQRLKLQRMTLMLVGALVVLMVVTLMVLIIGHFATSGGSEGKEPSGSVSGDKVIWATTPVSAPDTLTGDLVLVNSGHKYSFPTTEDHLRNAYDVWAAHSTKVYELGGSESAGVRMEANALTAVDKMLTDMAAATGYTKSSLAEGYRTHDAQEALGSNTKGGYSDHHTGRLCRISTNDAGKTWLAENAHRYGFVMRYPNAKSDTTGVSDYESAFRYVGVAHATYMVANNLCLEEYVEYLKANVTDKKPLSVTGADGKVYEIYYYTVNGSATVKYPTNFAYTISGTNDGGVVVTVDRSVSSAETTPETTPVTSANAG